MNIWNKVLVGLIAVMLLPLFYFSAVALKTHQTWRSVAKKIEAKLPVVAEEIEEIRYGNPQNDADDASLQSVRVALYEYLVNRGRVWPKCIYQGANANEYVVSIETTLGEKEFDREFPLNKILFVFDEARATEGGCFLGEFKVKQVDGANKKITLAPTMEWISPKALKRLQSGKGLWTLCEIMPKDMHKAFEGMTEVDARKSLPASVVNEYLTYSEGGTDRKLREYYVLLKELDRQRSVLVEEYETAKRHEAYMVAAANDAKDKQRKFRQDEKAVLMAELDRAKAERDAAAAHQKSLQEALAQVAARIDQLIADNRAAAKEMAKMQDELIRRVDQRTAVAAQ